MSPLFRFPTAVRRDPAVQAWLDQQAGELGDEARRWFERMRACGPDVRELMHDGAPTACVEDAAFGYVNVFKAHANVGFFLGAQLEDPGRLLEGTGKRMRHVKLRPERVLGVLDEAALRTLIDEAYAVVKAELLAD
jgi:hypothetical protein